jgi:hypothetical protein
MYFPVCPFSLDAFGDPTGILKKIYSLPADRQG